jgi:muramidase (phage lysozyme)
MMMAKRKDGEVDISELQDQVADLQDGVADALEHLRAGRIDRAVKALERVEPEPEDDKD